ncbi:MAG: F0F1 ATP synthase subunit A [Tepidiformaceae bacterium]
MKIALIAIGLLAFIAVGFLVASGPQPHIVIPGELLWTVGPLKITSTLMAAWFSMIVLIIIAFFATRSIQLIPSGFQNFIEAVLEFLYNQVEEIAGPEHARRFFIPVATLFLFILIGNWGALLPFFKTIGITYDEANHIFHEIEVHAEEDHPFDKTKELIMWNMEDTGGIGVVPIGAGSMKFKLYEGEEAHDTLDRFIVTIAEHFTDFESDIEAREVPSADEVVAAAAALEADPDAPKVLLAESHAEEEGEEDSGHHGVESAALGGTVEGIAYPTTKLAIVNPFFRAAFSDLNNTLALAIMAFIFIEMWGFQVLGVGYLGKFFVAPWKSPIMMFVGFLELLSEFIRVISFSFRLFGNIFAGSVLLLILTFLVPFLAPTGILALELFVGFIQAAVFSLLVLVFGLGAVASHHEDDHEGGHGHDEGQPTHGAAQAH